MLLLPKYFIYVYARANGQPFYVGKGTRRRIYAHINEAKRGHVCWKCCLIRKMLRTGEPVLRYIVFATDDEQEAYDKEQEIIALIGRDKLTNQTDGGDGIFNMPPESIQRISEKAKARAATPEGRARLVAAAAKQSPEAKRRAFFAMHTPEAHAKRAANFKLTPEGKARRAELNKARVWTPEMRAAMSEEKKGKLHTEDARAKIGAGLKGRVFTAEHRANISAAAKKRGISPEMQAAAIAATKGKPRSDEFKAKLSAAKRNQSEETRRKNSESNKRTWERRRAAKLDKADE